MAEEQDKSQKTEQPTPQRLEEARKKGDIAKSQDLPIWFLLIAGAAILSGAEPIAKSIADPLVRIMDHPQAFRLDNGGAEALFQQVVLALLVPMSAIFMLLAVAAFAGHLVQARPLWTTEKMKPDISKLDPMKGFGRVFGPQGWMNLLKAILKVAAVAGAIVFAIWPKQQELAEVGRLDPVLLLGVVQSLIGRMLLAALVAVGLLAALDYFWQRHSFMERMKMSRREIQDEHKQSDGDPHVKARLRAIRMERSQKRMMANVPTATVVVTNPTHYSVALRYDQDKDAAPICVAKGVDAVALRIREKAKEHNVPIVENVPLARALYSTVEIDEVIPREHFEAVAKVIGFVLNTAGKRRRH